LMECFTMIRNSITGHENPVKKSFYTAEATGVPWLGFFTALWPGALA
jgi:hypothetical protein